MRRNRRLGKEGRVGECRTLSCQTDEQGRGSWRKGKGKEERKHCCGSGKEERKEEGECEGIEGRRGVSAGQAD